MRTLKTALAGFGAGGRVYNAPILASLPEFSIEKILTSSPQNISAAKERFPKATVVQDFSEILSDETIELVVIVLPNHLHYKFAKEALQAGKNVVVEKPFTVSVKEADELISLAEEKNLILSVNHNRRWDSDFRTVHKLLKTGRLGDIVSYEAHFDRFRPKVKDGWKEEKEIPGSGILYDLGSHLIEQALYLFGKPDEVFADIRTQRAEAEVPDDFELLLFYPKLRVRLKAGMLVKEKGPTFIIHGTRGSFVKYGMDVQEEALKNGKKPEDFPEWGEEPEESWGKINIFEQEENIPSEKGDYRNLYRNVHAAITEGKELAVKPQQAREVIRVIELAQESHEKRCAKSFDKEFTT